MAEDSLLNGTKTETVLNGRLQKTYRDIFAVHEIEQDLVLKWFTGAILLGFFVTFSSWNSSISTTLTGVERGQYICWPFFQNCKDFIWLETLPYG